MEFEILQLQSKHLAELSEFLQSAYPGEERKANLLYLHWYYLQNPNTDSAGSPPVWAVTRGNKIVGQLATIPVQLKAGASYTKAIWILEFILLEEFRGKGLGKRLVLAARERYPTMITLGINEASTRVFASLGWKALGSIHRYHRMLFAGSASRKLGEKKLLRESLNLLSSPLRFSIGSGRPANRYQMQLGTAFGPELDELWERASKQWPAAVRRNHQFLAWQFLHQPGKAFDVIRLYEQKKLVGYAVLFFRKGVRNGPPPKAAISDLVYDSRNQEGVIDALLEAALKLAIERKAGSLVTDVLDTRVESRLKRFGFWRIKNSPRFMASSTEFQEILYKPENWYLTRADSDVSIFEEPNVVEP
jgi:GNAT superfamily N-acetyltransferase